MQFIFHAPMAPDGSAKFFSVVFKTGDIISVFRGGAAIHFTLGFNHTYHVQIFPILFTEQPVDIRDGPITSNFNATMIAIRRLVIFMRDILEIGFQGVFEEQLDIII